MLRAHTGFELAIIGGVGRSAWAGARTTFDVDVLVGTSDLNRVNDAAPSIGLVAFPQEVAALAAAEMTRLRLPDHPAGEVRLDVIAAIHPYHQRVLARARPAPVFGVVVPIASAEDIVVLKTLADRPQDRADVAAILSAQRGVLDVDLVRKECATLEIEPPAGLDSRGP